MNAKKIISMGAVLLSLSGCKNSNVSQTNSAPVPLTSTTQSLEQVLELEGKILKVQPATLSYIGDYTANLGSGHGTRVTANHEFEYVILMENNGKWHTFIYPTSKAILDHASVAITYIPLASGSIDSKEFIKRYMDEDFSTDDHFQIGAEGIIIPHGIKYKNPLYPLLQ